MIFGCSFDTIVGESFKLTGLGDMLGECAADGGEGDAELVPVDPAAPAPVVAVDAAGEMSDEREDSEDNLTRCFTGTTGPDAVGEGLGPDEGV